MAGALPPWTGYNFVPTLHHSVPDHLDPAEQGLPSPFVVCITGASRGIGAEIAKAFAAAGASALILTARTETALKGTRDACHAISRLANLKISTLAADAGSAESARRLASVIEKEHDGRLDVLVNNAGIMATDASAFGKFHEMDDEQITVPTEVNYIGRLLTIKCLLPLLLSSDEGANEFATDRLTKSLAESYAAEGLIVHAVHPGMVEMTFPPGFPEAMEAFYVDDAGLCGASLVWLVRERRGWLSGRYLSASWDVGELEGRREEVLERDLLKMRMLV
ncbi:hypothetical protein LTR37_008336 [Vermiconidia calcicola]|uniref:Uncharacterized protein n=1 Tax=Vermiconidia calcicola TaxID=1690605 RepID=A0ACC3NC50_9PEZI|nr:hypothetical protein LTR37_008336 [Vermiconidia calcicola]